MSADHQLSTRILVHGATGVTLLSSLPWLGTRGVTSCKDKWENPAHVQVSACATVCNISLLKESHMARMRVRGGSHYDQTGIRYVDRQVQWFEEYRPKIHVHLEPQDRT